MDCCTLQGCNTWTKYQWTEWTTKMRCWQTIIMLFCIDTALQQYYYFHSGSSSGPSPPFLQDIPWEIGDHWNRVLQWDRCLSCNPTISVKTVKALKGTQSTNLNLSSPNTGLLTERALLLLYMLSNSSIVMLYWYPDMEYVVTINS